jgi:hypothetical protein
MNDVRLSKLTGVLIILTLIAFNVYFTLLSVTFGYLLGAASAASIIAGMFEPVGFGPAADIVVVGYILWSIWLALTGILLLLPASLRERRGITVGEVVRQFARFFEEHAHALQFR